MALEAGRSASVDHRVDAFHTALAVGSGDVPVLATPVVLAWCEAASMAAIAGDLADSDTTVGMRIHVDHVRPTGAGAIVTVHAELARVEGRRLVFAVRATHGDDEIAYGQITRVIVDRSRFIEKAGPTP